MSELKFKCPDCGNAGLECRETGCYVSSVTDIDADGDFSFGAINASGEVDNYGCTRCNFTIMDEGGEVATNQEDVAQWCVDNCEQE
jgi:hypothetical protein